MRTTENKKVRKLPPLPYTGAKTRWLNQIDEVIQKAEHLKIVIDVFGGSGVVSRYIKDLHPNIQVYYNNKGLDYINRLAHIDETITVLNRLEEAAVKYGVKEYEKKNVSSIRAIEKDQH